MTTSPTLALENFVPYRLSVLSNTVSGAIARSYADRFGLTIPEWRIMAVLGRFAPLTASEVSARTAMDKVRVSRAVAGLLKSGRIERTTDSKDRRRVRLRLSPAGRRVYREIVPFALSVEDWLLAALTVAERRQLADLLGKLQTRAADLWAADPLS